MLLMIDRNKIVENLMLHKVVEGILCNICKQNFTSYRDDMINDLYLHLLTEINEHKLKSLIDKKELKYYLVRIIKNSICSKQGRLYRKYTKYNEVTVDIAKGLFNIKI